MSTQEPWPGDACEDLSGELGAPQALSVVTATQVSSSKTSREQTSNSGQNAVESPQLNTLMIRNVPASLKLEALRDAVESIGFAKQFDALYLVCPGRPDVPPTSNLGYAFINFPEPQVAAHFAMAFTGFQLKASKSKKVVEVKSSVWQGLDAMFKRVRLAGAHPSRLPFVHGATAEMALAEAMKAANRKLKHKKLKAKVFADDLPGAATCGTKPENAVEHLGGHACETGAREFDDSCEVGFHWAGTAQADKLSGHAESTWISSEGIAAVVKRDMGFLGMCKGLPQHVHWPHSSSLTLSPSPTAEYMPKIRVDLQSLTYPKCGNRCVSDVGIPAGPLSMCIGQTYSSLTPSSSAGAQYMRKIGLDLRPSSRCRTLQ